MSKTQNFESDKPTIIKPNIDNEGYLSKSVNFNQSKKVYGWILSGIFLLGVILFISYTLLSSPSKRKTYSPVKLEIVSPKGVLSKTCNDQVPADFIRDLLKDNWIPQNSNKMNVKDTIPTISVSESFSVKAQKLQIREKYNIPGTSSNSRFIENDHVKGRSSESGLNRNYSLSSFIKPSSGSKKPKIILSSTIKAKLLNDLISLNPDRKAIATVMEEIPSFPEIKNAKVLGQVYTLKRYNKIYIRFTKLILKNGTEIPIFAHAIDINDDEAGIIGQIDDRIQADVVKVLSQGIVQVTSGLLDAVAYGHPGRAIENAAKKPIDSIETERIIKVKKETVFKLFFDESLFI